MSSWFASGPDVVYPTVPSKPIATGVVNAEATVAGLSEEQIAMLTQKVALFSEHLSSAPETWEAFFTETAGVKGIRKFVEGEPLAVIRSETVMPCHIVDAFSFFTKEENIKAIDDMFDGTEVISKISPHSWIAHDKCKGVWPVSPRDFLEMNHWRLLDDGSVLLFHFSFVDEALKPVDPTATFVRGVTHVMGHLLRPSEDGQGTDVRMIFNSNPNGDLPAFMVNQAVQSQPNALVNAKKALVEKKAAGALKDVTAPATYEDFVAAISA